MIKVQLHDGRIKEFKDEKTASNYAQVTGGEVTKTPIKAKIRAKIKQFKDRT